MIINTLMWNFSGKVCLVIFLREHKVTIFCPFTWEAPRLSQQPKAKLSKNMF